ncbi:(Fe-S)-binding protein [Candidatus Borrarchaeum sp.]|uniref:(Fe-S)-binding protein n=1 Tax=Candidatus Borrarchaeum sp. TaxID=2846742 RepID=UPI00257FD809|nr:(Fe-S)-binding protein [Candidatus Borrarchaeum sp.]
MSEEMDEPLTLQDQEPQLWTCICCYCGLCIESCPAYRELKNEAVSARGISQVALGIAWDEIDLSELSDDIVYACTGCRWCDWICSQNTPIKIVRDGSRKTRVSGATVSEILRSMKAEEGTIPPEIRDALNNIVKHGNPYGGPKAQKDKWVDDLGMKIDGSETILYVGSTVPYDDRAARAAEALVSVFKKANLNFGILGSEEMDSGAFPRMMGEEGLFFEMYDSLIETFEKYGIKKIICLSPHDYDTFREYYYDIDGIEVKHYTEVLWEMIDSGKIEFNNEFDQRVTYHDPCYLGRRSEIYDAPRKILQSIPKLDFVEMYFTRENAHCCGGGGTGLWLDLPKINMDMTRSDEAKEKDVDYLAVACPICLQMLDSAMKSKDYEIEVRDIAEIVEKAM